MARSSTRSQRGPRTTGRPSARPTDEKDTEDVADVADERDARRASDGHRDGGDPGADVAPDSLDPVLAAARVLVALSAQSVAELADTVTLPQLRLLVMVESRTPMNLSAVADELGVHPSNATRAVDRLVSAGLLTRREDRTDRRNTLLELTTAGTSLVERVMQRRRAAIATILADMSPAQRQAFVTGAAGFAAAGGETPDAAAWEQGWPTP